MSKELPELEPGDDFKICRSEAWLATKIWLIQSATMVGLFLLLGYYRTDDPFGFPLGVPSWYLFGAVLPALVFLVLMIYVILRHFREVPVR